jgi:8-oxo-dGTP diphosphatase
MLVHVAAAIIFCDSKVFLAKRAKNQHQGGLWEFPGGKCESGESPENALIRELFEEVAIIPKSFEKFDVITHDYGDKKVCLHFFLVDSFEGEAKGNEGQLTKWFDLASLSEIEFPAANRVVVDRLLAR